MTGRCCSKRSRSISPPPPAKSTVSAEEFLWTSLDQGSNGHLFNRSIRRSYILSLPSIYRPVWIVHLSAARVKVVGLNGVEVYEDIPIPSGPIEGLLFPLGFKGLDIEDSERMWCMLSGYNKRIEELSNFHDFWKLVPKTATVGFGEVGRSTAGSGRGPSLSLLDLANQFGFSIPGLMGQPEAGEGSRARGDDETAMGQYRI